MSVRVWSRSTSSSASTGQKYTGPYYKHKQTPQQHADRKQLSFVRFMVQVVNVQKVPGYLQDRHAHPLHAPPTLAHATAPCSSSALLSPPELPSSSPLPFFCSSRCCSVFLAPPSPAPGGVRVLGEEEEEPCCSCCSSSC